MKIPRNKVKRRDLFGDGPTCNSEQHLLVDKNKQCLYVYGGCPPNSCKPVGTLHRLDLKAGTWTMITLKQRYSNGTLRPCSLPKILSPAMDIVVIEGETYILLFGGCWYQEKKPPRLNPELFAVNLEDHTWAKVEMEGRGGIVQPVARIGASMVVVREKAFIFGGGRNRSGGWDVSSFAMAEFDRSMRAWKWIFFNHGLPTHLCEPQLLQYLQVNVVNQGQDIVFATGRHNEAAVTFDLSCQTWVKFNVEELDIDNRDVGFSALQIVGELPTDVTEYMTWPTSRQRGADDIVIGLERKGRCFELFLLSFGSGEGNIAPFRGLKSQLSTMKNHGFIVVGEKVFILGYDSTGKHPNKRPTWNVGLEFVL